MDQAPLVYKVDNPVKSSLLSSLVLPNTRLSLNPTLRALSYNTDSYHLGIFSTTWFMRTGSLVVEI